METKKEKIEIRVTKEEKEMIKSKSKELGYNSMSAFLIDSSKDFFKIELDISYFRELAKEINYIGKNINNLIHFIFTQKVYSDNDLKEIKNMQEEIKNKLNKEYDHLLKLRKKYTSSNLTLKEKEKIINDLTKEKLPIPKELLLKEVFEMLRNNILFVCNAIEMSPEQEEGLSDYVYEFIFDDYIYEMEQEKMFNFSDEIYLLTEKIKSKMIDPKYVFSDDDWWELKDILDEYEN